MQDVELVEDDEPGPGTRASSSRAPNSLPAPTTASSAPPAPGGDQPASADRPRERRRLLTVGAGLLVVAVAAAGAGQLVASSRERARVAAIAEEPRAVDLLSGPPAALWEVTDDVAEGLRVRVPGGPLVGVRTSADGRVHAFALDPRTGGTVWQVDLLAAATTPDPALELVPRTGTCVAPSLDPAAVVCLVHDGAWLVTADGPWSEIAPTAGRMVVLDADDGSIVTDLTHALGQAVPSSFAVVGDLVVSSVVVDGEAVVSAMTTTGAPAWEVTVPAAAAPETFVMVLGDLVAVVTPGEIRLLDVAGRTVRSVPVAEGRQAVAWRSTELYVMPSPEEYQRERDGGTFGVPLRTTVVRPDGDTTVAGEVVPLSVDDGSVPGLVLTSDGRDLQAWDGDGRRLWSFDVLTPASGLLLDGRLHVNRGTELLTLDARTGAEMWRSDATTDQPVTDGRHLLARAVVAEPGAVTQLVALDPADGSEMWRSPLPDDTAFVESYLRLMIAYRSLADGGFEGYTVVG